MFGVTFCEPESATDPVPDSDAEEAFVDDHERDELLLSVIVGELALKLHEGATTALLPPPPNPPPPKESGVTSGEVSIVDCADCEEVAAEVLDVLFCVALVSPLEVFVFVAADCDTNSRVMGPK